MMRYKFDANQECQIRAVEAATDLLEGQPRTRTDLTFPLSGGFAALPNRLDLDNATHANS